MLYKIFINEQEIGTSLLESGDPPMGVASGLIRLNNISIRVLESRLLQIESTQSTDGVTNCHEPGVVRVIHPDGFELSGQGSVIENCLELEECYVTILGIHHEMYEKLFLHHIEKYRNNFKYVHRTKR
ncbi:hypothetical protein PN466_10310 [Roseofilum reptotaenium CS-1145]|uniref:Uncharacterized protein n=1 Tax=Roseofilum reptotaenium AO1-A TaxID=1925591 RepID=A0A1L9QU83_9CYAN|nr:hypothetical protein [Roseofilum reptotaenium]MDB9517339.1 hypothetical protein [Roseofilum reptotaenium CS-1145]OJJ26233.1 hypothetical protein BI308_07485 [Roseofilum reptotaenium AO1-A]